MLKVGFYKGKGTWYNRLIRWWTGSPYSHVELMFGDEHHQQWWLFSSSSREGGVRFKKIGFLSFKYYNWTFVELGNDGLKACDLLGLLDDIDDGFDIHKLMDFYGQNRGKKYDYLGIALSQVLPLNRHDKNKYFCSEFVAEFLGFKNPHTFSPALLYTKLTAKKTASEEN